MFSLVSRCQRAVVTTVAILVLCVLEEQVVMSQVTPEANAAASTGVSEVLIPPLLSNPLEAKTLTASTAASMLARLKSQKEDYDDVDDKAISQDNDKSKEWDACEDFELIWLEEEGEWKFVEGFESHYQQIDIYHHEREDDVCLFLSEYLHACASNRPHYHEVFVHYPARFLDKVERVLFIGGGDSMVLHEVLKYEHLQKVVGLELDQQVVRTTFSRIGTRPFFHDDRVEWYFGDAAKTLRALPKEYYGTFDLVVVDILSAVADALRVTEEHTIMDAAMLLLQPNGVIIKNEDEGYEPGSSSKFTKHTADIVYRDVPVYCLQTFVIGSNGIDFSKTAPKDHDVPTLYLKDVYEFQSQFDTWYTTSNGTHGVETDNEENDFDNDELNTGPLGLLVIIEAEKTSKSLEFPVVQVSIHQALKRLGFIPVTGPRFTRLHSEDQGLEEGYILNFILTQGAVVARCFPNAKYCAFDVQLWEDIHKLEDVKEELLSAVGSEQPSLYRIITSGIQSNIENANIGPPSVHDSDPAAAFMNASVSSSSSFQGMKNNGTKVIFQNATLHSYDNRDALNQWLSQTSIGIQTILQFNINPFVKPEDIAKNIEDLLKWTFKVGKKVIQSDVKFSSYEIGDYENGLVVTASWSLGNVVVFHDGESRVDMNLFYFDDEVGEAMNALLMSAFQDWPLTVKDEFPRGMGLVVSFRDEYSIRDDGERPSWA